MKVTVTQISEEDFNKNAQKALFSDGSYDRKFEKVCLADVCFYFGCRSDLVDTIISEVGSEIYSIGIDQNFAIVDFENDRVLFKLKLPYNFYTVKVINEKIFVATELEILEINKLNFEVQKTFDLPDFFQAFFIDTNLEIKARCINGESVKLI